MVKCLVFHKQAASSYTLPETLSLRRGFKEKHVYPPFGAPSLANGDFTIRKILADFFFEHVSWDLVKKSRHSAEPVHV